MSKIAAIIGRILLAFIFIVSGVTKLMQPAQTAQMLENIGWSSSLVIPVGIFELVAGALLAIGFMVRLVSLLLFGFTALTILFFHYQITDPVEAGMAMKNLAIMGGLLLAFAHSQMWSHYYAMRSERRGELAARDAEARAHEAELRAVRAETRDVAADTRTVAVDRDGDGVGETRTTTTRRRWFDW